MFALEGAPANARPSALSNRLVVPRGVKRLEKAVQAAQFTRTVALLGVSSWLMAWSMFLMATACFDDLAGMRATIVVPEMERGEWLRQYPDDLELDLAPGAFALRAGPRLVAAGKDAAALDPARIGWLARWRPRVVVHVEDGVSLARVVAAMDVLAAAGFFVAFDTEPR